MQVLEGWAHDRTDSLTQENALLQALGPGLDAGAYGQIQIIAGKVHRAVGGHQTQIDLGVRQLKAKQPGDQPAHGEGAGAGHHQPAFLRPENLGHAVFNQIEGRRENRQQARPGLGQIQAIAPPLGQGDAQTFFQLLDLAAHRPVGDAEFFRRLGDLPMTGGGLKGAQGIEGRELSAHDFDLSLTFTHRIPEIFLNYLMALECYSFCLGL